MGNASRFGLEVVAVLAVLSMTREAAARDYDIVSLKSGERKEVYFQVNLGGNVYLDIRNKDGAGCATLEWTSWWNLWRKEEQRQCGFTTIKIPGVFEGAVWGTLWATAEGDIKIGYSADERVAHSITFDFP
jgi:hypothetical protein